MSPKLSEAIEELFSELSEKEARVLRLRYGLDDGNLQTRESIGEMFRISRARIQQIEAVSGKQTQPKRRVRS